MKTQISDNPTIKRIFVTKQGAKEINGSFDKAIQEKAETGNFTGKEILLNDKE